MRGALSAVLLGVVLARIDAARLRTLVAEADLGAWFAGLALTLAGPLVTAQRFRVMIRNLRYRVSLASILAINLEAMFFSLTVPGDLVSGLVRWDRIARHTRDRVQALSLIAAERLVDWTVLATIVAAGAPLLFDGAWAPRLRVATLAVSLGIVGAGVGILAVGRAISIEALVASEQRLSVRFGPWIDRLGRLVEAGHALTNSPRRSAVVILWSLVYVLVAATGNVLMARAVLPTLPVLPYIAAMCALTLVTHLPISLGGLGVRELSLPALLGAYGVTPELGLLVGLSVFVPYVILAIAGLVVRLGGLARLADEGT